VTVRALRRELPVAFRLGGDVRSSCLLLCDVFIYRCLRALPGISRAGDRRLLLRRGIPVYYRRNRGDLHTFREVWLAEAYRLPFALEPRTIVDLGANVGLTSLWLSCRYPLDRLVAVEPSASNVKVLRKNLSSHNVSVIHAAVGPVDGSALFAEHEESHLGRVGSGGVRVRQVSMRTVLAEFRPHTMVDLLKVDIEGFEEYLFSGDVSWLQRIRSIIIEIHPLVVDRGDIVARIRAQGFTFVPAGSVWPASMDAFVRIERGSEIPVPAGDYAAE
jgi:FkbM family methyltransferase